MFCEFFWLNVILYFLLTTEDSYNTSRSSVQQVLGRTHLARLFEFAKSRDPRDPVTYHPPLQQTTDWHNPILHLEKVWTPASNSMLFITAQMHPPRQTSPMRILKSKAILTKSISVSCQMGFLMDGKKKKKKRKGKKKSLSEPPSHPVELEIRWK